MTDEIGQGMAVRLKLAQLARRFEVVSDVCIIPLTAPTDGPMVLEGLAVTPDIDLTRMRLAANCFGELDVSKVKLLYKHGEAAGTVDHLRWDRKGNLHIRATVQHELGRRCGAFSVAFQVRAYTMHNENCPDYFAEITSAILDEVSCCNTPANQFALVTERKAWRPSPLNTFFELMKQRVELARQRIEVLQFMARKAAETPPPNTGVTRHSPLPPDHPNPQFTGHSPRRRPTSFSTLIDAINNR